MQQNIQNAIREELRRLCEGPRGKQEEVAGKLGVSRSYLNKIIRDKCPVSGLTVATLEKMFPRMVVYLNGDTVNAVNTGGTRNCVVGFNNGTVNAEGSLRLRILEAVIGLDIPPDALQAVLKTIKEVR